MEFIYSDGGRSKYFKSNKVGDCVCRAICNATGYDYKEIYNDLNKLSKQMHKDSSARNGIDKVVFKRYIETVMKWKWHPTMHIGEGCKVHLDESELPKDKMLIIRVSKHLTCYKDGVIYDTYDCTREGNRCVYGYWAEN